MSLEGNSYLQELSTVQYLTEADRVVPELGSHSEEKGHQSSPGSMYRWLSGGMFLAFIVVGASCFWLEADNVSSSAATVRQRTSSPLELVLWIGGSERTMADVMTEIQKQMSAEVHPGVESAGFESE